LAAFVAFVTAIFGAVPPVLVIGAVAVTAVTPPEPPLDGGV
jgi:hypothetical protein